MTRLASKALRRPVIHSFRGFSTLRFGRAQRWLYCRMERLLARMSAQIVAVSPSEAESIARAGIAREGRVVVIPNGLDYERLRNDAHSRDEARRELGLPPSGRVVGTVARADRAKGLEVFVGIAAEVTAANPAIRFVVIGVDPLGGGYAASVRTRAAKLGVEVTWAPPRADGWRLLPAFDLYLSTSLTEGLPNGPLEASALGIPVLLSDVQGNRDALVPGRTGELFPLGERQRAAAMISAWDAPGFLSAPDAGPAFVRERFLIEHQAGALAALYRRVASSSRDE